MAKRVSLEDRPQYISNPRHRHAVDTYLQEKGPEARRRRAMDRKFRSDCDRLDLFFPRSRASAFSPTTAHNRRQDIAMVLAGLRERFEAVTYNANSGYDPEEETEEVEVEDGRWP